MQRYKVVGSLRDGVFHFLFPLLILMSPFSGRPNPCGFGVLYHKFCFFKENLAADGITVKSGLSLHNHLIGDRLWGGVG